MKRVKWYLVLLLVGILLIVGCAKEHTEDPLPTPPTAPEEPIGYSDVSIPIETFPNQPHIDVVMSALVGQELTVTLGSNPTTGFQWSEDAAISDETVIRQVDHEFVGPGIDLLYHNLPHLFLSELVSHPLLCRLHLHLDLAWWHYRIH